MRIKINTIHVCDQKKAVRFYTEVLGFIVFGTRPAGKYEWIALSTPGDPNGVKLMLEPCDNPHVVDFHRELFEQGIPRISFEVDDLQATYLELESKGVDFVQPPKNSRFMESAVFDDTCGNLIEIYSLNEAT